jgi:hypothetical protein
MELHDRPYLESKFAARLAKILTRHSRELTRLLGNPPDPANVPAEFWERMRREKEDEDALMLYVVLLISARQHLDLVFAHDRVYSKLASDERLQATLRHLEPDFEALARQRAAQNAAKFEARSKEILSNAAERGDLETRDGIRETKSKIFGVSRAEREVVTGITGGRAIGGEKAMAMTVGLSPGDLWMTVYGSGEIDKRVCPTCEALNNSPRQYWSRFFAFGPPAHESCRCEIVFALEAAAAAPSLTPTTA